MKHSKRRRILSALLAAVLVFAALPAVGFAEDNPLPAQYATVRIEANGFGKRSEETSIGTVLGYTVVDLSKLDAGSGDIKAIDVVNKALSDKSLAPAAGSGGFYTAFDGVFGESGTWWQFMLNHDGAMQGLDDQSISSSDEIVLMLTGSDQNWLATTGYAHFRIIHSTSDIQWGFPYGEVTLALKNVKQSADWSWQADSACGIDIKLNGNDAWTPSNSPAKTDSTYGMSTITLWGDKSAGAYYFDITADVEGSTRAFCRATMVYDGTNPPELFFSAPQGKDTTLKVLELTFPEVAEAAPSDALLFVGTTGFEVKNEVESVQLAVTANSDDATIAATYQSADDADETPYTRGSSVGLAVGSNVFKIAVTNGEDVQIHTLTIVRKGTESERDLSAEACQVMDGIITYMGNTSSSDWMLALHAAGEVPSQQQKTDFLSQLLVSTADFAHNEKGSAATMAKAAIALTSLGIDARKVKDLYGGAPIDLVQEIGKAYNVKQDGWALYSAPFILSLFDLPGYGVPAGSLSTRTDLIDAILSSEEDWINEWGFDGAGMALPALAPYYQATEPVNGISVKEYNDITAAVNRTLDKISQAQTIDGGLGSPNANTIATVITGLSAVNKNAAASTFTKAGSSLVSNLLTFRTAQNTLGYTNAAATNAFASLQGYQALATWKNLAENNGRSSNLYHFNTNLADHTEWPSNVRLLTDFKITAEPTKKIYALGAPDTLADTAGIELVATYNKDPDNTSAINVTDCTVSKIDASTPGTKTVIITYEGWTVSYFVTVKNAGGGEPTPTTVSVTVRNHHKQVMAADHAVPVEPGRTTALDVLKAALKKANVPYDISRDGYVKSIDGIGEFSAGANSGWLYSVNGTTPPTTAAADYPLNDGDVVLWYLTTDYTKDPSSQAWTGSAPEGESLTPKATIVGGIASTSVSQSDIQAALQASTGTTLTIEPTGAKGAKAVEVTIPATSATAIADDGKTGLSVKTPLGTVTIPNDALGSIASQASGSITVRVESVDTSGLSAEQQQAVGNEPVYDISILSGGKQISSFDGKSIAISLPYELKEGEDASGVAVWYLNDAGELQRMRCTYDPATGMATFKTTHLSKYLVGYTDAWYNPFKDVRTDDWFFDAVLFAAERELFSGVSETSFAPERTMTRAMLVTVLYRAEGSPAATATANFADVESGQWYTEAIAWAVQNGIATGYDSRTFGANDAITREQMAQMLYRYASYKEFDVRAEADFTSFSDAGTISPWAKDGMTWAVGSGLIQGISSAKLAPNAQSTRAQVATVLMRLLGEK